MPTIASRSGRAVSRRHSFQDFGRDVATSARNVGVSHTHVFGARVMNELRMGWLRVTGGQVSANRGVDFAGQVGLQGVTRDPRDIGFPQISTAGLYSTMGDPTSFVYRGTNISSSMRTCLSIAARITSNSARTCFIFGSGPNSPTTRAAPSAIRDSSPETPSPTSCLAIPQPRPPASAAAAKMPAPTGTPVRAGRLARAPQPDRQRGVAVRIQPAHARRRQQAVVDRLTSRAAASSSRAMRAAHQQRGAAAAPRFRSRT